MMSNYLSIADVESRGEIFLGEPQTKQVSLKKPLCTALGLLASYFAVFACVSPLQSTIPVLNAVNPYSILSLVIGVDAKVPVANVTEVFELKRPLAAPLGSYQTQTSFFNESDVTGSLEIEYVAPEVFNFTGALFALNFSVEGTQEPAIFELYLDEHPIWRTSTPNPLGGLANSSTTKNVTELLPLFASDSLLTLQLIDGAITGNLNVSLGAVFYNDSLTTKASLPAKVDVASLFEIDGPASVIIPLSNKGEPYKLPLDSFSVTIPQVGFNVTQAKVKFFASATDEETKFYESAINGPAGGASNGPVRNFNVYLDSVFVGAVSPNPILLKADHIGGASDAAKAWSPLAAPGAFDALEYEIDLSSVLPILWGDDSTLVIEVSSPVKSSTMGVPPLPLPVPAPGVAPAGVPTWLISGNFFAWESPLVNASIGEIIVADSLTDGTGILVAPPMGGITNQIVRATVSSGIISQLNFTLIDGSLPNLTANFNTSSTSVSVKNSRLAGASNSLTYIGSEKVGFSVVDEVLLTSIYEKNVTSAYPLAVSETKAAPMVWGPPLNSSLKFNSRSSIEVKTNGFTTFKLNEKFNTTVDALTYGTDASVLEQSASYPIPFTRKVSTENGVITKDSLIKEIEEFDFNLLEDSLEALQEFLDLTAYF